MSTNLINENPDAILSRWSWGPNDAQDLPPNRLGRLKGTWFNAVKNGDIEKIQQFIQREGKVVGIRGGRMECPWN